jgi:two-component system OmpR family response regulator
MRILLAEDDRMIGDAVLRALRDAAFAVDWVRDGNQALAALQTQQYELVLLDLGLPGRDGLDVLKTLRKCENPVPVLVVTARDAVEDRIQGLDLGADDYVLKPFEMGELLARMRAVARRRGGQANPILSNGTITLDPGTHEARNGASQAVLTAREFALMLALMSRPGAILSRAELEERIYGWSEEVESNAVEFLIHSIRKKLGTESIKNVRGVGWMVSKGG